MNEKHIYLERRFIDQLINIFESKLGFKVQDQYHDMSLGINYIADGFFSIEIGNNLIPVVVEVKEEISSLRRIKKFIEFTKNFDGIGVLVSSVIDQSIKDKLRASNVGFYEIDREVYMPLNLVLDSKYKKNRLNAIKRVGFKAEAMVKLLLYLVAKPEALSYTQRDLSQRLDLSLGAINKSLSSLENAKCVFTRGTKKFLGDFDEVASVWRNSLRRLEERDYSLGRFTFINQEPDYWREQQVGDKNIYWGGEVAASLRTNYLYPELFRVYTYENRITPILKSLRLKKDPNGELEILKCFWPNEINNDDGTVPDFVIYCELINSGIDRNIETAQIIKEKLVKKLRNYEY